MQHLPIIINGKGHRLLKYHLDSARFVLNSTKANGLSILPVALELDDAHGVNVTVNPTERPTPSIHIDYEVAGYQSPFLNLAKPIYLDSFFEAAYADVLPGNLSYDDARNMIALQWRIEDDAIHVDYRFGLSPSSCAYAAIKLGYILEPLLVQMYQDEAFQSNLSEEVLANALFCCSMLTRSHKDRPDVFFLNLAIGIRLADAMRDVFYEAFTWEDWPEMLALGNRRF